MLVNQLVRFCLSASKLCLTVLLISSILTTSPAQALEVPHNLSFATKSNTNVASSPLSLSNGTHLYGETNVPGAVGREYVVFDHQGGQAIGAVFLAGSEYSCFSGQLQGDRLKMMVLDAYANAEQPYDISLEGQSNEGIEYQPVKQIGQQEMNILDTCRNFYRQRFSRHSIQG
jgi:hypothetical protein